MTETKSIPWYLMPFWALWQLVSGIVLLVGRLLAVVIGGVFMIVGIIISLTIIGALIGIPLFILGLLLVLRGLF